MSGAIGGIVDFNNKVNLKDGKKLKNNLNKYKLEDIKDLYENNVFMTAGVIHITKEDKYEVIPYYNKEKQLIITADVIIDNREELFNLLNIMDYEERVITDSELLLLAYERWQTNCPKYILGDYAFVIYDIKAKQIFCARDHVGTRTLYYKYEDNVFKFSTVLDYLKEGQAISEKWIADFLAMPVVMHQYEAEETPYENIYQIPAATILIVDKDGIKKEKYWDITKNPKILKLGSDEEYDKAFRNVLEEAVKCKLRTCLENAITLSGGLDSSTVAAFAAPILKEENKSLKAFTSIPMDGYDSSKIKNRIADESKYVIETKSMYENIQLNFCKSENTDSIKDMKEFISAFEQPYKTFQNTFWIDEILKSAKKQGCNQILISQFGNFTISYGHYFKHMKTLLKDMRYFEFIKEIIACSKLHDISILFTCKHVFKNVMPYNLKCFLKKIKNKNIKNQPINFFIINKELVKKYNIYERFKKYGYIIEPGKINDIYYERRFALNPALFAQIGTIETKLSLKNGVLLRDPTKDKRVIEFCFSLPSEQFVRNGEERYLIRRNMKNLLPNSIVNNEIGKGLQSADWLERLKPKKDFICNKLHEVLNSKICDKYLDIDIVKEQLVLLENNEIEDSRINMQSILTVISLYEFLVEE